MSKFQNKLHMNLLTVIIIFLEIGRDLSGQSSSMEPYSPSDPAAAYQQQQLLEEQDDHTDDPAQLPPDSILDTSDEETAATVPPQPSTTSTLAPVANTTYGVPCQSTTQPSVSAAANTTHSVPAQQQVATRREAQCVGPTAAAKEGVSAMEGVTPTTYSGSPPTEYFAIKNCIKQKNSYSDLIDGDKPSIISPGTWGSFFYPGDTREYLCKISLDINGNKITSSSFDLTTMSCNCCGKFMQKKNSQFSIERCVLVLADQTFPAALPAARDGGNCLKIYRSESASLLDIVGGFLAAADGWRPRAGSIALLCSASHLARVGIEQYVTDYLAASLMLRQKLGVETGPAPMLLLGGTDDKILIRSLVDLATWQTHFYGSDNKFCDVAIESSINAMAEMGLGGKLPAYDCRYGLPTGPNNPAKKYWVSTGLINLPVGVGPLSETLEKKVICELITALNERLAFDLDPSPNLCRQVAAPGGVGLMALTTCLCVWATAMPEDPLRPCRELASRQKKFCSQLGGQPQPTSTP